MHFINFNVIDKITYILNPKSHIRVNKLESFLKQVRGFDIRHRHRNKLSRKTLDIYTLKVYSIFSRISINTISNAICI